MFLGDLAGPRNFVLEYKNQPTALRSSVVPEEATRRRSSEVPPLCRGQKSRRPEVKKMMPRTKLQLVVKKLKSISPFGGESVRRTILYMCVLFFSSRALWDSVILSHSCHLCVIVSCHFVSFCLFSVHPSCPVFVPSCAVSCLFLIWLVHGQPRVHFLQYGLIGQQ